MGAGREGCRSLAETGERDGTSSYISLHTAIVTCVYRDPHLTLVYTLEYQPLGYIQRLHHLRGNNCGIILCYINQIHGDRFCYIGVCLRCVHFLSAFRNLLMISCTGYLRYSASTHINGYVMNKIYTAVTPNGVYADVVHTTVGVHPYCFVEEAKSLPLSHAE